MEHILRYARNIKVGNEIRLGQSARPFLVERADIYNNNTVELRIKPMVGDNKELITIYAFPDDMFQVSISSMITINNN